MNKIVKIGLSFLFTLILISCIYQVKAGILQGQECTVKETTSYYVENAFGFPEKKVKVDKLEPGDIIVWTGNTYDPPLSSKKEKCIYKGKQIYVETKKITGYEHKTIPSSFKKGDLLKSTDTILQGYTYDTAQCLWVNTDTIKSNEEYVTVKFIQFINSQDKICQIEDIATGKKYFTKTDSLKRDNAYEYTAEDAWKISAVEFYEQYKDATVLEFKQLHRNKTIDLAELSAQCYGYIEDLQLSASNTPSVRPNDVPTITTSRRKLYIARVSSNT